MRKKEELGMSPRFLSVADRTRVTTEMGKSVGETEFGGRSGNQEIPSGKLKSILLNRKSRNSGLERKTWR